MKIKLVILMQFIFILAKGQNNGSFFDRADDFFKTYTKNGQVNYAALKNDPVDLNWLTNYLSISPIDKTTEKAYLINAYNIWVIQQIVIQPNLPKKPTDIPGFFDKKSIMLAGNSISLNQLENELIRPAYKDPRVHFVLVCAGLGCPPIADFAYRPENLEDQLAAQTKIALNNPKFVYEDVSQKKISISQIFEWYLVDFGGSTKTAIDYINEFRETPFDKTFKVGYYPYDWTLNKGDFEIITNSSKKVDFEPLTAENSNPITIQKKEPNADSLAIPIENNTIDSIQPVIESIDDQPENDINLQTFTAGALLGKGKFDLTLFNTLYTENRQNWQGQDFSGYRATFVTQLLQITYGLTASKRINIGLDINFKNSGRAANDPSFGAISRAFAYQNNDSARVGITSIGARLKLQPFGQVQNFSIQSTLLMPTVKHPEGFIDPSGMNNLYWAEWDRITWWNQLFFDKTFGKFQLFTEIDFLFRFKRYESQIGMLDLPASVFFSYFPTSKITLYGMTQHVARFTNNINGHNPLVTDWVIPMNYTASGFGIKYAVMSNFNLELLYTNFWRGQNSGLGQTFNLGIKFITR